MAKELCDAAPSIKGAIVNFSEGKRVWRYWTSLWYDVKPRENKRNTLYLLWFANDKAKPVHSRHNRPGTGRTVHRRDPTVESVAGDGGGGTEHRRQRRHRSGHQ